MTQVKCTCRIDRQSQHFMGWLSANGFCKLKKICFWSALETWHHLVMEEDIFTKGLTNNMCANTALLKVRIFM